MERAEEGLEIIIKTQRAQGIHTQEKRPKSKSEGFGILSFFPCSIVKLYFLLLTSKHSSYSSKKTPLCAKRSAVREPGGKRKIKENCVSMAN